ASERLGHEGDAGEVMEGCALLAFGAGGLAGRSLGDIDPQLALERGLAPAFERGDVAREGGVGLAEALDGVVDLADLGEGLAGAGPEGGLGLGVAFEVGGDVLLEIGELLREPAAPNDRLEVEERQPRARVDGEHAAVEVSQLELGAAVAGGDSGDVDAEPAAIP